MDIGLKDKVVVITGGAGGIGREMVKSFIREGAKVAICGRNKNRLEQFIQQHEHTKDVFYDSADVGNKEGAANFAKKVADYFGGIDVWINNAGIEVYEELENIDENDWDKVINVNLGGTWKCSVAALPYLKKSNCASIINISSFCSLKPTARNAAYSVSKAAVNSLTKVMAAEFAPYGIRVNAIIPGMIVTEMTQSQVENMSDKLVEPISMNRLGKPEEIANGALFLASPVMAGYVDGHCLVISGGKFLVQNTRDPWNDYVGGY